MPAADSPGHRDGVTSVDGTPADSRPDQDDADGGDGDCGSTVAFCSQCQGLPCLLEPQGALCKAGQDVCKVVVEDPPSGGRRIDRYCEIRATAKAEAAANPAACENVETRILPTPTPCVFVCDGIAFPNCNLPPALIPVAGRLFAPP